MKVSTSCHFLWRALQTEVALYLLTPQHPLLPLYELGVRRVLETFLAYLHTHVKDKSRTDRQSLLSITNALFVSQQLLPALIDALKRKFKQRSVRGACGAGAQGRSGPSKCAPPPGGGCMGWGWGSRALNLGGGVQ